MYYALLFTADYPMQLADVESPIVTGAVVAEFANGVSLVHLREPGAPNYVKAHNDTMIIDKPLPEGSKVVPLDDVPTTRLIEFRMQVLGNAAQANELEDEQKVIDAIDDILRQRGEVDDEEGS